MNTRAFWSLFRLECQTTWRTFAFPIFAAAEMWVGDMSPSWTGGVPLTANMAWIWFPLVVVLTYGMIFQNGNLGFGRPSWVIGVPLEFAFSRAWPRRAVFAAKALLFGLCLALPVGSLLVRGWTQPDGAMEVFGSAKSATYRERIEYYQSRFPGGTVTPGRPLDTLSLPGSGRVTALTVSLTAVIMGASYLALAALGGGNLWWRRILAMGSMVLVSLFSAGAAFLQYHVLRDRGLRPGTIRPPSFDSLWADLISWSGQHLASLALAALGAALAAGYFAAGRFARQEVTA